MIEARSSAEGSKSRLPFYPIKCWRVAVFLYFGVSIGGKKVNLEFLMMGMCSQVQERRARGKREVWGWGMKGMKVAFRPASRIGSLEELTRPLLNALSNQASKISSVICSTVKSLHGLAQLFANHF